MDLLLLLAAAGILGAAARAGDQGRRVVPGRAVERLASPEQAVERWRRAGVRGRVLVHFARSVAMSSDEGPLSPANYVERAMAEGIVRSVVHVIPDDAWAEVEAVLAARPEAERIGVTFRLWNAGEPIVVVPRTALLRLDEPALVTIEGDRWSVAALRDIAATLETTLRADLVAWTATDEDRVGMLEAMHASP